MTGASNPQSSDAAATADAAAKARLALVADLERRIDDLTRADESDFGRFTAVDWAVCVLGFVVLPYLAFLFFWP